MTSPQFQFDGHSFTIKSARIFAHLNDPVWCDQCNGGKGKKLMWCIAFESEDSEVDDEVIAPTVDIDDLAISPSNWTALSGIQSRWETSIRPETKDRYGMTYVWDHSLISSCRVEFGERTGDSFAVVIAGENEDRKRFEVSACVPFTGIDVYFSRAETAESVAARLATFLDISNLTPSQYFSTMAKNDASYNAGYAVFVPKN